MSKFRKAVVAALTAAAAAVVSALTAGGVPSDTAGWTALASTALGAAVVAFVAVYKTPNAPAVTPPSTDSVRRTW